MIIAELQTSSPSAAPARVPASLPLELCEARQLRDSLRSLLRHEQSAMADFLVALADFDRRRGWERLGHASFFAFLHFELRLSNSAAFYRMSAARLLQRFPDLIEPFRDGRLCLSTAAELSKVLTEANQTEVVRRFFGISAREAQEVVAELQPRTTPPLRAVVTSLASSPPMPGPSQAARLARPATPPEPSAGSPAPYGSSSTDSGSLLTSEEELTRPVRDAASRCVPVHAPPDLLHAPPRNGVEPLTADLRRLHITVSRQFLRDVETARDALSHAIPNATTEQVLQAGLRLLLEKQAKGRGNVKKPRAVQPTSAPTATPTSTVTPTGNATRTQPSTDPSTTEPPPPRRTGPRDSIPAAVRRAVWARDGGRCSWPLDGGGCCGSTRRLELDHVVPWAEGGGATEANLRVVCSAHNRLAARVVFGERWMGRYTRRRA